MKTIPLKFRFKGQRNYIQGPDIYNQMLELIMGLYNGKTIRTMRLSIHNFGFKQCEMVIGENEEILTKPNKAIADFYIETDEGKVVAWLVETDYPIEDRYDYNESRIEGLCKIDGERIIITGDSGFSTIEVVVSMTKQLHYRLFPSDEARWFFTKLELAHPLEREDSSKLVVNFKHNFNNRLTKSEIMSGEESIGYIYFSLVKR